jgi:alpha-1,3-rhamnosyl/mannosyltransferase
LEQRRATLERNSVRDGSYFLCVGTLEPRKNVEVALRAHARLPPPLRSRFPLVLVGMHGWLTSRLEHEMKLPAVRGELLTPGYVTDEDLADLYSGACALLYPSIYEGFGLPPLEAMACSAPVIMSNASSLPEVGGAAAVMHDPHNADALNLAMRRMIEDPQFRRDRSAASLQRAAQFSWHRCARETLTVYKNTLAA